MRIETEQVRLSPVEARKAGKDYRKVYWVRLRTKRIGPYARLGDANIAVHRIEKILRERETLREDLVSKEVQIHGPGEQFPARMRA